MASAPRGGWTGRLVALLLAHLAGGAQQASGASALTLLDLASVAGITSASHSAAPAAQGEPLRTSPHVAPVTIHPAPAEWRHRIPSSLPPRPAPREPGESARPLAHELRGRRLQNTPLSPPPSPPQPPQPSPP
eukprot:CAMPEP_0206059872 /NCGR_PEP_ID=MMETSP1466-20131121/50001_1 /ASSEMBLY_ACC=CAM_ASM_001126 /TAXON_ID=44452 /ORGANISM="Pavlova gyrans, Strain CCMP608" /LENGTH=132 /DNA_ID=CAMNT_0053435197 /DNA_START=63 /DNA_END=458 /DNA_ORIENTATION=+